MYPQCIRIFNSEYAASFMYPECIRIFKSEYAASFMYPECIRIFSYHKNFFSNFGLLKLTYIFTPNRNIGIQKLP